MNKALEFAKAAVISTAIVLGTIWVLLQIPYVQDYTWKLLNGQRLTNS